MRGGNGIIPDLRGGETSFHDKVGSIFYEKPMLYGVDTRGMTAIKRIDIIKDGDRIDSCDWYIEFKGDSDKKMWRCIPVELKTISDCSLSLPARLHAEKQLFSGANFAIEDSGVRVYTVRLIVANERTKRYYWEEIDYDKLRFDLRGTK